MKLSEFKAAALNILAYVQIPKASIEDLVNLSRILTSVGMMVDLGVPDSQLVSLGEVKYLYRTEGMPQIIEKATSPTTLLNNRARLLTSAYETVMSLGMPLTTMFYDSVMEALCDISIECEDAYASGITAPRHDKDFMKLRLSSMSHWCFQSWKAYDENNNELPLSLSQEATIAFCESWANELNSDGTWDCLTRNQALQRICLMRETELKNGNDSWHEAQENALAYYGNFATVPPSGFHTETLDAIEVLLDAMNSRMFSNEDRDKIFELREILSKSLKKHMKVLGIDPTLPVKYKGYGLKAIALATTNDSQLFISRMMGYPFKKISTN